MAGISVLNKCRDTLFNHLVVRLSCSPPPELWTYDTALWLNETLKWIKKEATLPNLDELLKRPAWICRIVFHFWDGSISTMDIKAPCADLHFQDQFKCLPTCLWWTKVWWDTDRKESIPRLPQYRATDICPTWYNPANSHTQTPPGFTHWLCRRLKTDVMWFRINVSWVTVSFLKLLTFW